MARGVARIYEWAISKTTHKPITWIIQDEFKNPLYWLFAGVAWRFVPDDRFWGYFITLGLGTLLGHFWFSSKRPLKEKIE